MAILGGQFALIALVTGSEQAIERLRETLPGFESELDLKVHIERAELEAMSLEEKPEALLYRITAVAMDHPGIVHRISSILARSGVNVAALDTRISLAPTTGTPVFALTIEAQVPASLPVSELRALLDDVATRENLDLELHAVT